MIIHLGKGSFKKKSKNMMEISIFGLTQIHKAFCFCVKL